MSSKPRDVLFRVVAKYGTELSRTPARVEGILKDLGGDHPEEIFALATCLRAGMIDELRAAGVQSAETQRNDLTHRLEREYGLSHDGAEWAIESWVVALRLIADDVSPRVVINGNGKPGHPSAGEKLVDSAEAPAPSLEAASGEPAAPEPDRSMYIAKEPKPRRPLPDWSAPARSVIVYPEGSSDGPSLREALEDIQSGTQLILKPGLHRSDLIVGNDLCLRGEGGPVLIVLQSLSGSAILVDGGTLLVSGIGISASPNGGESAAPVVEIRSGHLTLEECDLRGREFGDIISATGATSELVMRRCHLHKGGASGLLFRDGAMGYAEECQFYQNKLSNLVIGRDCSPVISRCKISHSMQSGIYVYEGGGGLIENCDIWKNSVAAIECRGGGNLCVRHCRISGGEQFGFLLAEASGGTFESCVIFENVKSAVSVGEKSSPRFIGCRISENHEQGIDLYQEAEGEFVDCEIYGNGGANVLVRDKSSPRFIRCIIHDGQAEGLQFTTEGRGHFQECEISSNGRAGAWLSGKSQPHFETCFFRNGLTHGIMALGEAEGVFKGCEISEHTGTAVVVSDDAHSRFERCVISRNLGMAVYVDAASPTFINCAIDQNGGIGFACTRGAEPQVTDGEICKNAGGGLVVSHQGKGRWENVHLIDNRGDGMLVSDGGQPSMKRCRIESSEGAGLHFRNEGQGTFEDLELVGNFGPGVEIAAGTNPILRQLQVSDGKGAGILVHPLGGGRAEKCEVHDNAGGDWQIAANARLGLAD